MTEPRNGVLWPWLASAFALSCGLWFVDLYAFTFKEFWRGVQPDQWGQLPRSLGIYAASSVALAAVLTRLMRSAKFARRAGLAPGGPEVLAAVLAAVLAGVVLLSVTCAAHASPLDLWPAVILWVVAAAAPIAMPRRPVPVALGIAYAFVGGAAGLLAAPAWSRLPLVAEMARVVGVSVGATLLGSGLLLLRFVPSRLQRFALPLWALSLLAVVPLGPLVALKGETARFRDAAADAPNLVVITGDTLRAASMSSYGGPAQTPAFDAFAARGMRMQRYYTAAPWTIPSLESLWTSRYPPGFSAQASRSQRALELTRYSNLGEYFLPGPSIVDALEAQGYQTTAFVTNPAMAFQDWLMHEFEQRIVTGVMMKNRTHGWVDSTPLLQGVLGFLGAPVTERPMDLTWLATRFAHDYLDNIGDRPFLLWIHFLDPHTPYDPPTRFRHGPQVFDYLRHDEHPWVVKEHAEAVRDLYAGEIRYVDEALSAIMDRLAARGLMDNTYVLFSADHGEEIVERGGFGHGHTLFDEQIRVPFAIVGPGIIPGVIEEPVSALDVVPTLAELLGLEASEHWRGRSWVKRLRGQATSLPAVPIYTQATGLLPASPEPLQAVIEGDLKLIRGIDTQRVRLFDVNKDPAELRDVAEQHPQDVMRLRRYMDAWTAGFPSTFAEFDLPPPNEFQKSAMEGLKALGYAH